MSKHSLSRVAAVLALMPTTCLAALSVNPPQPITHRVSVQMIQTALDDGSSPATVFGNPDQRASIEASINTIWAQAGIEIDFLDPIVRYNDTIAYQGAPNPLPSGYVRSQGDLGRLIVNASAAGISHSDPSVINMFFVRVVPGFSVAGQNTASGVASLGSNGIALFIGSNFLTNQSRRDTAAHVVAHEIGHNLGLLHTPASQQNLMSTVVETQYLNDAQVDAVHQTTLRSDSVAYIPPGGTGFLQAISQQPSDLNGDGIVDAADYTTWRDGLGSLFTASHFDEWKAEFGATGGAGAVIPSEPGLSAEAGIPEPTAMLMLATGTLALFAATGRRR